MAPAARSADDESLKRLGGGRWQTRDERFTIEPQSGTWAVVDAEETDDLGLPLVRGPFRSLTDAKAAIAAARGTAQRTSPLAERLRDATTPRAATTSARPSGPAKGKPARPSRGAGGGSGSARHEDDPASGGPERSVDRSPKGRTSTARASDADDPPAEPSWFRDLTPADRGRARRLIEQLTAIGHPDAASVVRRDLLGDLPAIAAAAIEQRLLALPDDAAPRDLVELLRDGRDEGLGVRWRLVDGDGRPILVELPRRR